MNKTDGNLQFWEFYTQKQKTNKKSALLNLKKDDIFPIVA